MRPKKGYLLRALYDAIILEGNSVVNMITLYDDRKKRNYDIQSINDCCIQSFLTKVN